MPCNVVVRADGDTTLVEALDPRSMVELTGEADPSPVAEEAVERLRAALDRLTA